MKKLFISLMLVTAMILGGSFMNSGNASANDLLYLGVNYEGNYGLFFGTGHTVGKVAIMPYVRYSIDSTLKDDKTRFKQSVGFETAIFLYDRPKYKLGLMAGLLNVDWVEKQNEPLGTYIPQSAGVIGSYHFSEKFSLAGWLKGKTQLFVSNTEYPKGFNVGLALVVRDFDLAKLLPF